MSKALFIVGGPIDRRDQVPERVRTVTLVLQGGHLIRLGGAVDVQTLARNLESSDDKGGTIEIRSGTSERLILRRDALLGIMEGYATSAVQSLANEPLLPYFRIEHFLPDNEREALIRIVLDKQNEFEQSTVVTGVDGHRKSMVLNGDEFIVPLFTRKISDLADQVGRALGKHVGEVKLGDIECQVTAHLDGGYYHAHADTGSADTAGRVFSYVYYFQSRPRAFFGGELKLYEPRIEGGEDVTGADSVLIKPEDNTIIFFPSQLWHEILPTYVPSKLFSDSRFTVNGWIRRSGENNHKSICRSGI